MFHIKCISHVINLSVTVFVNIMGFEIDKIREIIDSIKYSVKKRDFYTGVRVENGLKTDVPKSDCRTR